MSLTVTTHYESYPNSNVGKVVAKFGGRQATVRVDQALNSEGNHRLAAERLLDRLDLGFRITRGEPAGTPGVWVWQAENPNNGPTEGYSTYYTFRVAVECFNDHGTYDEILNVTGLRLSVEPEITDAELGTEIVNYLRRLSDMAVHNQSMPRVKEHRADREVLAGLHHIDWDTVNVEEIGAQARTTWQETAR